MKKNKDQENRSVMTNIKFLVANAWKWDKGLFGYFGFYTILTAMLPFIGIFAPKFLIDELTGAKRTDILMMIIVIFFVLSVTVNYLVAYLGGAYYPKMIKIRFKFITMMQKKSMTMDFKYTEDPKTLNDIENAWSAAENNDNGIEGVFHRLFALFGSTIAFMGYIAIVSTLNPFILLYLLANVLVIYFLTLKVKRYEHSRKDDISELNRKSGYVYNIMHDFSYGKDIRIYGLENWFSKKFKNFRGEKVKINEKIKYKYFVVSALDVMLLLFREGIIYAYLIYRVIYKGMGIGDFSMYFVTIGGFATWMQNIMTDIAHIRAQNLYINDYRDFLEFDDGILNPNPEPIPDKTPYEIEFKNVAFKYPNSEKYIYKNLSLKIKAGERLAIVGINGAGKTTFVKLITRLYEPLEGKILLNGVNIARFDKDEYYKKFSVVFQEIKMLAFSVAENVALVSEGNIDREKVNKCIDKAGVASKINSLERGIDTSVLKILDEKGVEFSGGENQKLALARALYKEGDIIVLDEPTAALDPIAEYNIYRGFDEMIGNKTAIYISHRLSSTRFCDVIAFFEDGEIKEYGTHDELLSKDGRYAEMFNIQAHYYKEKTLEEVI
ncbi:ABC transporter ATP-binding protein [Clostridium tagluense]|uniref:ABC transporter ATP-binding protein n=1 Tax=Clostridium tagluense TaxID=360422 RepID=A0A401UPN0_9CLOT|nr:ABC transporter ATP-binding protein [Clostridium tagluense]GCD11505.1 ABC transporter ATP-binding protein [Clostridium tagluense]